MKTLFNKIESVLMSCQRRPPIISLSEGSFDQHVSMVIANASYDVTYHAIN